MSGKTIGIAIGAALAIGTAGVGGYMLLKQPDESSTSSAQGASSADADDDGDEATLTSIAAAIPEDVDVYVEVPNVRALAQGSANMKITKVGLLDLLGALDQMGAQVGEAFGMSARDGSALVSSVKAAGFAVRPRHEEPYYGAVLFSRKGAVVEKLLATSRFGKQGKLGDLDKYTLKPGKGGAPQDMLGAMAYGAVTPPGTSIVWLANKGLLVAGTDAFLRGVVDVTSGKGKSLADNAEYKKATGKLEKARVIAFAPGDVVKTFAKGPDEERVAGFFDDPGSFLAAFYTTPPGLLTTIEGGLKGPKVPKVAIPAATKLELAKKLPADTLGYVALSTELGLNGADVESRLVELFRAYAGDDADGMKSELDDARKHLGAGLAEVVDAVGDQIVVGLVIDKQELTIADVQTFDVGKNVAFVGLAALKDEAAMKKIVSGAQSKLPTARTHTVTPTKDGGFEMVPRSGEPSISVRYPSGMLFVGVGPTAMVKKAFETVAEGKKTLASDAAHDLAMSAIVSSPHVINWIDGSRFLRQPLGGGEPMLAALDGMRSKLVLTGDKRLTFTTTWGAVEANGGYRMRLDMLNSFGIIPALGVYGVRRYLSSAKASEAKQTVAAISRGAAASHERESADGSRNLCGSATPVPSVPPSGTKYQPSSVAGSDFETGDDKAGWRCLKFSLTQPHYYQYGYTVGGPYKGPAVGGPDPGPNGFEAWAVGDLDGDGVTSLFTRTGKIDASGRLVMATQIFIHNENE